ncbi:hypothetical protein QJS10_CPB04g00045 [Acorus calamus]|uniref:Uncharacterized protein n=1 Tax=Acorus calamus TaxID=4465 RepID=A0AAV9EZW0_ACOCL|nr:hypothetical protein QJS10_CPB04g00045 [Acorus calamus]
MNAIIFHGFRTPIKKMENNTPPTVRYNTKKVANRARGKRPSDPTKGHPGAEKFQTQPLYFEEELDILFGVTAARGDDSYVPTGSSSARGKRSFGGSDSTTVEDQDYEPQFTDSHPYSIPTPSSIPPTANVVMKLLAHLDIAHYPHSLLLQRGKEPQ